ncbi:MAG: hypothetical protein M1833_001217 [Piccolia ochrophora]|nr:MAG: hypothetical protein M1833_001217 [Piccolia ochrophora]
MTTLDTASLPVIDFARIVAPNSRDDADAITERKLESEKLFRAFVDVGFVYLRNHSIPEDAREGLFSHAQSFFQQQDEEKAKVETGEAKAFHGWFSPQRTSGDTKHSDQKEAFDVGRDDDPTRPNQWPANLPGFQKDMNDFFQRCHEVHLELLRVLAKQVGIDEDFFEPFVGARDHWFRVLYYPETTRESFQNRVRAGEHTDYGTLTLLFNDDSGGLQVRHANGQYIDAPPIPGTCIINVGDMLARWFNDKLRSTQHRVVEPAPKANTEVLPARYAIAWFGHPNRDALVEPIEACCTSENPKKYEPVYAGKHVVERLAYLHKKGKNSTAWSDDMQRKTNVNPASAAYVDPV